MGECVQHVVAGAAEAGEPDVRGVDESKAVQVIDRRFDPL